MSKRVTYKVCTSLIASVWLANGLFCKVLNFVPRHERIVARILGAEHSHLLTEVIGLGEIGMALWVFTGIKSRLNSIVQIIVIATMNSIEIIVAPDLLLWGKLNGLFAFFFILFIYYNEFKIKVR